MDFNYYPFGMVMPGRSHTSGTGYRYGFNGKENDNEVKGNGNQQDYGVRVYDTRLGRFLSIDPLSKDYPWYTPYQFAGNTPIQAIDLDGMEPVKPPLGIRNSDWIPLTMGAAKSIYETNPNPDYQGRKVYTMPHNSYSDIEAYFQKPVTQIKTEIEIKTELVIMEGEGMTTGQDIDQAKYLRKKEIVKTDIKKGSVLTNVTITIPESYSEKTDVVYTGETKALVRRDLTNQGYEIDPKNVNVNYSKKEDSKSDGTSENATFKIQIKYKAEKKIEVQHKVITKSYGDEVE